MPWIVTHSQQEDRLYIRDMLKIYHQETKKRSHSSQNACKDQRDNTPLAVVRNIA